jgi:hypothetical protein
MESRQYCTAAFLDVSQAFDKVWNPELLFKIKRILPSRYSNLLKSYLNKGRFETKINGETSNRFHIHSAVRQGSILYVCTIHIWLTNIQRNYIKHIRDDTSIFATHEDPAIASLNLQEHLHIIEKWLKKWKIKVDKSKSSNITFTLRKGHCPAFNINHTTIPQTEVVKYLGLHFDCRLNWKEYIAKKRNKST